MGNYDVIYLFDVVAVLASTTVCDRVVQPAAHGPNAIQQSGFLCRSLVLDSLCKTQWWARVIFVESESRALRVRVIWNFVESKSRHDLVELSQSRVTRMVESLRIIGLQARVNVESYKISNFSFIFLAIGPPVDFQWL